MRRREPATVRTGPKYPGTCDFTSEPDENGKRWWEYRAAEPDPGDDPDYEDC